MDNKKNKIIVTGGAGFIGSHIVDELISLGHEVHIVDDMSAGKEDNINPKAIMHKLDIRNGEALHSIFAGATYVFHEAAMPQVQFLTDHHLFAGCYYRSILVPAGCALTGAVHLHDNILCLVRGKAYILNGPEPQLVEAPWCGVGPAGTKRVGLAIEDCVFLSALATSHTDVARIEQENVVPTYKEYDERKSHELCYHGRSDCRGRDDRQRSIECDPGRGQPEGSGGTDQAEQGEAGRTER
jgi:hypothetical protein